MTPVQVEVVDLPVDARDGKMIAFFKILSGTLSPGDVLELNEHDVRWLLHSFTTLEPPERWVAGYRSVVVTELDGHCIKLSPGMQLSKVLPLPQ